MRSRCSTCLGALAIILLGGACANAASPGGQGGPGDVGGDALAADVTAEGADTVAVAAATSAQEKDLLRLREEEKLARDVYLSLRDRWGTSVPVFDNISGSEQTHMDRVATRLTALGIPDPVTDPAVGAFTDPELKALYTQLVASGQPSLVAALTVGATIEDLDIHDIEAMRANTTDPAILATYAALECGSRNHMRAFYGFLTANGGSYRAQFITQAELDAIIAGAHEQCGMGTGPGRRGMGRRGGWR